MKSGIFLISFIFISYLNVFGQAVSILPPASVFTPGEIVKYTVSYNWGIIWVDAGQVEFTVKEDIENGVPVYKFKGKGGTYPKWDWIYKVDDLFTSTNLKSTDLSMVSFQRNVHEGTTIFNEELKVSEDRKHIVSTYQKKNEKIKFDTLVNKSGLHDVLSLIYMARCFDYSALSVSDSIPLGIVLENKVYNTYIRYLGEEEIEIEGKGKINCFVFRPLLIEGTIFSAGEEMTVWVSKDRNRVPILVETSILVGKIKGIISTYENLKYPLDFRN